MRQKREKKDAQEKRGVCVCVSAQQRTPSAATVSEHLVDCAANQIQAAHQAPPPNTPSLWEVLQPLWGHSSTPPKVAGADPAAPGGLLLAFLCRLCSLGR